MTSIGVAKRPKPSGYAIALIFCINLGGCAAAVAPSDIKAFGAAATAVSDKLEKTRAVQLDLAAKGKLEIEASDYIRRTAAFQYPPGSLPTKDLSATVWTPRVQFLKALADYSQALANLEDPDNAAQAEKGVASLQAAVLSFAPKGAATGFIDPAGNVVQALVRIGVIQYNDALARQTVARAHPWVERGVELLKADLGLLSREASIRYRSWLRDKKGHLVAFTKDQNETKTALYKNYRQFVQENTDLRAELAILLPDPVTGKPAYVDVLDALVAAHAALKEQKDDQAALANFLTVVERLVALAKVART